jgi:hypothetical protein
MGEVAIEDADDNVVSVAPVGSARRELVRRGP